MALILASGSPRRKELLSLAVADYTVKVSQVDEDAITAPTPALLAQALGRAKCLAVAKDCPADTVLGCDTVVEFEGEVFGKPKDRADAEQMLRALSGAKHLVHTGVCVARGKQIDSFVVSTVVEFFPIAEADIQSYIDTSEPYDKAGGYAIQGHAAVWCAGIQGCYYNIMGLPVSRVRRALAGFGF